MYDPCPKTLFIGKKIIYLPSCHSTNDIAAELVRAEKLPEGTVVITDEQTAGRGQRGSRWLTSRGHNFTFSLLLNPTFLDAAEQFLLSQTIALGIRKYLLEFTENVWIKWPNDLYVNGMKIAGVLIENSWLGTRLAQVVVGIGLNINQAYFDSDGESIGRATSLRLETGQHFSLREQLPLLLQALEQMYLRLRQGNYGRIRSEYCEGMLGYGEVRFYRAGGQVFAGEITGISTLGKLRMQQSDGLEREYDVKEIEWLWPD